MKPRHAAAHVLAGWYLMCPPLQTSCWWGEKTLNQLFGSGILACEKEIPEPDAPFDQWENWGSYDSALACSKIPTTTSLASASRRTTRASRISNPGRTLYHLHSRMGATNVHPGGEGLVLYHVQNRRLLLSQ